MRVRSKIVLFLVVTVLVLIVVLTLVSDLVLKSAFDHIEREQIRQMRRRLNEVLTEEVSALRRTVSDWAPWDDTYAFVNDRNADYIASNLGMASITNLDLHLLLFFDQGGEMQYGMMIHTDDTVAEKPPEEAVRLALDNPDLFHFDDRQSPQIQFDLIEEIPYILVSHPILTSEHLGPPAGTLVFGRRIDEAMAKRFSRLVQIEVSLKAQRNPSIHQFTTIEVPVSDHTDRKIATFRAYFPRKIHLEYHRAQTFLYLSLLVTGLVLGLGLILLIERSLLMPLTAHIDKLLGIQRDHLDARLTERGGGEPALLAHAVNQMLDAIARGEKERVRADKLESIGLLAGGIAHDFNNILTAVMANLSLARLPETKETAVTQYISEAEHSLRQARGLTQQLLTFAAGGAPVRRSIQLYDLLVDSATFILRGTDITLRFDLPTDLPAVSADPGQIGQVLNNLVINAMEAMPGGGTLTIAARAVTSDPLLPEPRSGTLVRVEVRDTGVGIPETELGRIFEPYYSTKKRGSGLGLATCHSIITKHDGHILARSQPGTGTSIIFFLPVSNQPAETAPEENGELLTGSGRVLLMDDEPLILHASTEILTKAGYAVVTADDGRTAVEAYRAAHAGNQPFIAVVLDLTVSRGMGGQEAMREILAIDPGAHGIASSGYSNNPVLSDYRAFGFQAVLPKPYSGHELTRVVRAAAGTQGA